MGRSGLALLKECLGLTRKGSEWAKHLAVCALAPKTRIRTPAFLVGDGSSTAGDVASSTGRLRCGEGLARVLLIDERGDDLLKIGHQCSQDQLRTAEQAQDHQECEQELLAM